MSEPADRGPRVLLSGVLLGQPMGGVRRHNAELLPPLAERMAREGWSLAVLEGREPLALDLPPLVERLPSAVPARPALIRAALEGRALRGALDRARAAGRPFDLVHTAHLPAPRGLPVPYVLTLHDLRSLELATTPFARRLIAGSVIGGAVRGAAAVICVSETVRAAILERFGIEPERVAVVPNAADHFEPAPRPPDEDGSGSYLLHLGHLEPRKNLALLIEALAADADLPPLVLAGASKAGEGERLMERARALGVADRVAWNGPFEDGELPALLAGAACLVMPSRLEGFGIPVLEARRAGVPVAVARAGALPEVAGEGAPLFEPDDAADCARAIARAIRTDPAELEEARLAAEAFRWDDSAGRWFEVWRAVLEGGSGGGHPPRG